jgi:hypothetical protein
VRRAESRAPLLAAVRSCDRLVLLGDVLELRHGPVRDALRAAREVLSDFGDALGPRREVVIVPGNHDHHLLSAWLERRERDRPPPPLGLESRVDWWAEETLGIVAGWLAPASVRAAYPGVWLREDVYATHGHYCDRHTTVPMFERLGAGAMARIVREPSGGPRRAEDYEATLAPIYEWVHAIAQRGGPELGRSSHGPSAQAWRVLAAGDGRRSWRRRSMAAAFAALVAGLNRARLGPLRADLSGPELRRAALRAFGDVIARLQVEAPHVIFGHTHRAGPLPRDDRAEWRAPNGAVMLNTGSWVHEPAFLGPEPSRSPYRPGFCARLGADGPPELECLLDGR